MLIRSHDQSELPEVLEVTALAFAEEPEVVDLVRELVDDTSFIPSLSLVAEDEGRIIGHAMFTRARVLGERAELPVLALAPVSVVPERQREGVGAKLITEGISRAKAMREQAVVVLGHPDYYSRFGFKPAMPFGILPPHPVELESAWMALELERASLGGIHGVVHFGAPLQDPRYW